MSLDGKAPSFSMVGVRSGRGGLSKKRDVKHKSSYRLVLLVGGRVTSTMVQVSNQVDMTSSLGMLAPTFGTQDPVQSPHMKSFVAQCTHQKIFTQCTDIGHDYKKSNKDRVNEDIKRTSCFEAVYAESIPSILEHHNGGHSYVPVLDETRLANGDDFNKPAQLTSQEQLTADPEDGQKKAAEVGEILKEDLCEKNLMQKRSLVEIVISMYDRSHTVRKNEVWDRDMWNEYSSAEDTGRFGLCEDFEDECSKLKKMMRGEEPENMPDDSEFQKEKVKDLAEEVSDVNKGGKDLEDVCYKFKPNSLNEMMRDEKPEKDTEIPEEKVEDLAEEASDGTKNGTADHQDSKTGKTNLEDFNVPTSLEELAGTKDAEIPKAIIGDCLSEKTGDRLSKETREKKTKPTKQTKRRRKTNRGDDKTTKLPKKKSPVTGPFKLKSVAKCAGSEDNVKTDGPPNQNNGGNGKTSSRARGVGGCPSSASAMNGDDDDEDERQKPRPSDPTKKRLGCDRQARQKPGSSSSSQEDMDWEPSEMSQYRDGKQNAKRGFLGRGSFGNVSPLRDRNSCKEVVGKQTSTRARGLGGHGKVSPESQSEQNLWQQMQNMSLGGKWNRCSGGPAGDAGQHKYFAAHMADKNGGKPIPRTLRNRRAVVIMYLDNGTQAHRNIALSMPSCIPRGGTATTIGDPHAAMSLEVSPRAKVQTSAEYPGAAMSFEVSPRAEVETSAKDRGADDVPSPCGVTTIVEISPGVSQGERRHLMFFAGRVEQLKCRDIDKLLGQHEGVLLDKALIVEGCQYRDGKQYDKLNFLGQGSFGFVYLLQDKNTRKKVVGKQVPVPQFALGEATLWCILDHPGIVSLLGLLRTDDMVMFLSSYEPGSQTLQSLISQSDSHVLGQGRALLLSQQVLDALEYLHSLRIVHKDVKPDNLLILSGDRVKLIDFGLATRLTSAQHTDETLKGTECYMSPEIASGEAYDSRVDIWSLGCTLVCMISGHPPWFQRFPGVPTKIYIIAVNEPPLQDIPPNTDLRVRNFIEQTFQKDWQKRPTATQALEILPIDSANELYNTVAIEHEDESMDVPVPMGIPQDALLEPLTPWTPRGPENDFQLFPRRQDRPPADEPAPDMSISALYIPSDVEPRRNEQIKMEVEEDMYGPPKNPDDPEIFMEGALKRPRSEVRRGASLIGLRNVSRQRSVNAVNFDPPFNSHSKDELRNSWATTSFIRDIEGHPSSLNDESFELELMSAGGSIEEFFSFSTAHAMMLEAGQMPSLEGALRDEADIGGAVGTVAGTSGVVTTSPGLSAEDFASLTDTVQSIGTAVSGGIVAVISIEDMEPWRMRLEPDFSVCELAGAIVSLQHYKDSKLATKAFTLCWKETGDVLHLDHTFGGGEHQLVAVEATEGSDWCMDNNGHIISDKLLMGHGHQRSRDISPSWLSPYN